MAQLQTTLNNTSTAITIKNIRHRKEVKAFFRMVHPISKGRVGSLVSFVKELMPVENSAVYMETLSHLGIQCAYKVINDEDEVMSKLLLRSKQDLDKAVETPAAKRPLQDYIRDY
eukprot:5148728-Ditylum_brightwellii.AAC.1